MNKRLIAFWFSYLIFMVGVVWGAFIGGQTMLAILLVTLGLSLAHIFRK